MLADPPLPHGCDGSRVTAGYIVSGLLDGSLPYRRPPRILLMEQQVHNAQGVEQLLRTLYTSHIYGIFRHGVSLALAEHHTVGVEVKRQTRLFAEGRL